MNTTTSQLTRRYRVLCTASLIAVFALAPSVAGRDLPQAFPPQKAKEPLAADVDLEDVPIDRALKLLAELYDLSIVTGPLPEARVTMRLRGVGAEDALDAVAFAAGLEVERRGTVRLVSPRPPIGDARRIVPTGSSAGLAWLAEADVVARPIGDRAVLLEGSEKAVEAAALALDAARRGALVDRVFELGIGPGEEILAAVSPLLEDDLESATYDAAGHLLTVSALPATLERVASLVTELRRPPTQFEIEVRVVEVAKSALERMGAQGTFRLDVRGGLLPTTFPFKDLDDSARYFPSANDLAALGGIANGGTPPNSGPGSLTDSGFRFGQVDGRGIGFLIELLEQSGEARVVATPKVTTLDNRWARISMVTTLRIPTFTQNQAFATTTVSGIEEVDVGTTLEVRPRRGDAQEILLTVTPEVSELEPTVEVFSQSGLTQGLPVVTRRRTETEVILGSGETLVIGGLVRERTTDTTGKTPGLGDIPVIGRAFRHQGKDSTSSELLVFVTPRELPSVAERRAKARVDDVWLPTALATRVEEARRLTAAPEASRRVAGVRVLEDLDGELRAAGLDLTRDVVALGADRDRGVRVAAALFLIRCRPAAALGELGRFKDSREVALTVLAAPMAPHLRAALAELVARSDSGSELLARRLGAAVAARDRAAAASLLEALSAVAPGQAARFAADVADSDIVPAELRLDALGGADGHEGELLERAVAGETREVRAFALAALVRTLGSGGTAELLAGRSALAVDDALKQRIAAFGPFPFPERIEPALAWSGTPDEIEIRGADEQLERVREALALLARKAPDLRHLVGFALAEIVVGGRLAQVDPTLRRARVESDLEPERLAHQLVRLATLVFESRVRGFPARSGRSLARAVREEARTLERLTGAPCPPERLRETVERALLVAQEVS